MASSASSPLVPGHAGSWFAMLLLAGCAAVGPDHQPPAVAAPAHWSDRHGGDTSLAAPADAEGAPPVDRWDAFGDPELRRLIAHADAASPDLRSAALRVMQARTQQTMASAQRGPQVDARAAGARERISETGSQTRLIGAIGGPNTQTLIDQLASPFTLYQAGFDASWEPDLWGRVLRTEEAAQAMTDAQRASWRELRLSLHAEIARAYFELRAAQREAGLLADEIAAANDQQTLIAALHQGGLTDESALLHQRSQVAALQSQQPMLAAQQAQALNHLALLCGDEPGALDAELTRPVSADAPAALPDLHLGLPGDLARHRPDVAAAEAKLHAATADIGIAIADLYPRITLGASFGLESVSASKFGEWGSRQWSVGPSLNLPLFDRGRRRAVVALRRLEQQEAAVDFQRVVLKAWHEIDDAVSAYRAEQQRQQRIDQRLQRARDEQQLAEARHTGGLTSELPALGARESVLGLEREQAAGRARLQTGLVAIDKALGDAGAAGDAGDPSVTAHR